MSSSTFKAACATGETWQPIIDQCLAELGTEPSSANLGLLYLTEQLAPYLDNLVEYLRKATGIDDWVGTVGSGICYSSLEIYD